MNNHKYLNISYFCILGIICIVSFLTAKYFIYSKIGGSTNIIDVSEKYR